MTGPARALLEPAVDREARRAIVRGLDPADGIVLDGIDVVEVLSNLPSRPGHLPGAPLQRTLVVHLLRGPVPDDLTAARVRVLGGVRPDPRLNPVRVEWAHPADDLAGTPETPPVAGLPGVTGADRALVAAAVPVERRPRALVVRTSSSGDWSTYVLALLGAGGAGVPDGFDVPLASEPFQFTVDCPDPLDCAPDDACSPVPATSPVVDYLARDYGTLRTRLLDRFATVVPGWTDTNAADPAVTLLELFAYLGDRLTYWQDAAAAEAHLTTARRRSSVRRHARLLDYRMHEGCAARSWLAFHVDAPVELPARSPVAAADRPLEPGTSVLTALRGGATVFETVGGSSLRPARNALALHAWGDVDACLVAGSTSAFLRHPPGADPALAVGDVLVLGPGDAAAPAGEPALTLQTARRHAVRLDRDPVPRDDPLAGGDGVLEIHWHAGDALRVPLPVTERAPDGGARPVAVALANVVLAEHAASLPAQPLGPPQVPDAGSYRPRLPLAGLAWVDEHVSGPDATASLRPDPRRARAQLQLDDGARTWAAVPELLASGPTDAHVVAEPEAGGLVRLRFGDGTAGRRPTRGDVFSAYLRVGGGAAGNVGADVLTTLLPSAVGPRLGGVVAVTNPLPASGGADPEPVESVRELAPHAFRTQLRAVTSSDYAEVAAGNAGVQRAVARRRWTGSWYAEEVTLDVEASRADDPGVLGGVLDVLEARRLTGVDVESGDPVAVPLEIALGVCVAEGYLRADVERALHRTLSRHVLPDGRRGFFHPDNFSFGQPLFLSDLVAAVMAVPGVAWADVGDEGDGGGGLLRFRRMGRPPAGEVERGRIDAAPREVLRADSDPDAPENGRVDLFFRVAS